MQTCGTSSVLGLVTCIIAFIVPFNLKKVCLSYRGGSLFRVLINRRGEALHMKHQMQHANMELGLSLPNAIFIDQTIILRQKSNEW
jgi:hypothetical protein